MSAKTKHQIYAALLAFSLTSIFPLFSSAADSLNPALGWMEEEGIKSSKIRGPVCRGSFIRQEPEHQNIAGEGKIQIEAEQIKNDGNIIMLSGKVKVLSANLSLTGDSALYDEDKSEIAVMGNVILSSPKLLAISHQATYISDLKEEGQEEDKSNGRIELSQSVFSQPDSRVHGSASSIEYEGEVIVLKNAQISFCDPSEETWRLNGNSMTLNLDTQQGGVRGAKFYLGKTPVMYMPYVPFPLGEQRQTGFLIFELDFTRRNGFTYTQPLYINIAPNYDSTIYPSFIQNRGALWEQDFRWLTSAGEGELGFGYIHRDGILGKPRSSQYFKFSSIVNEGWSGEIAWTGISDDEYIRDLPSILPDEDLALSRHVNLRYASPNLDWILGLRDYQFISRQRDGFSRPYRNLPYTRLKFHQAFGAGFYIYDTLDYSRFSNNHNTNNSGLENIQGENGRVHNDLSLGWQGHSKWGKIHSRINWAWLDYQLDQEALSTLNNRNTNTDNRDESVRRNNYYFDFDASLIFSRHAKLCDCYVSFEPRFYGLTSRQEYTSSYAAFARNSFDTSLSPVDYDYLFNPGRYYGFDYSIGERRLSLGVESHLINLKGEGSFSFRLGKIIANEVDTAPIDANSSHPWAMDISWGLSRNNFLKFDIGGGTGMKERANGAEQRQEEGLSPDFYGLTFVHRDGKNSGVSLVYRKQEKTSYQDERHQVANNFVWYIYPRWSLFSGWRYDLGKEETTNSLFGFGYENCCFSTRFGLFNKLDAEEGKPIEERGVILSFSYIPFGSIVTRDRAGFAVISGGRVKDIYDDFRQ